MKENGIKTLLLQAEGCILGVLIGMQLPQKYRKPICVCCAWLGVCISGVVFLHSLIEKLMEKLIEKKEPTEEDGFIMRIIEEE